MGKGDYRLLRSIKFPGLDNTYTLPLTDGIEPYDENSYYYYGDVVEYNGSIWKCVFLGDEENGDEGIDGPFNPDFWRFFDASDLSWQIESLNAYPYDPWSAYRVGDVVLYYDYDILCVCIKDTPMPAGDINFFTYFRPVDEFDSSYATYGHLGDALNWTYNMFEQASVKVHQDNLHTMDEYEVFYDWTKVDESEDGFQYASAQIRLPAGYDYVINWSYEGWADSNLMYRYVADSTEGTPVVERFMSVPKLFRLSGGGELELQISSRYRTDGVFDSDTFELIDDNALNYVESNLFIGRIEQQAAISTSNIDKQISQDYTEIYKDYGDQWMNIDEDDVEYVESPPIPLDLGNISLVFRNSYAGDWDHLNVELIRYPHPSGADSYSIEPDVQVLDVNYSKIEADGYITMITAARNLQYGDEQWWYATLRFSVKPGYSPTWDLVDYACDVVNDGLKILRKPLTQSLPNPQRKNDARSVNQFLNIARSYFKGEKLYNIDPNQWVDQYLPFDQKVVEPYEVDYDDFIITPFSFITLCLRGIDFNNTPYAATLEFPNYPKWEEGSVQ